MNRNAMLRHMFWKIMAYTHVKELPGCFSVKNMIDIIQNHQINTEIHPHHQQQVQVKKQKFEQTFKDYSDNANVLISIQNSKKFVKLISSIRKVRSPNIFLYIENENDLVFIISSSTNPIILFKLPIIKPMVQVSISNRCLEFPYKIIQQWMNLTKSPNYYLNLNNINSKLEFEYITQDVNQKATNFEQSVDTTRVFNELFKPKVEDEFETKQINYRILFNLMKTYMIIQKQQMLDLSKITILNDSTKKFIVADGCVKIEYKLNENVTIDTLYDDSKNDVLSSHRLYYSDVLPEEFTLAIDDFSFILKSDVKMIDSSDTIYYVLCSWTDENTFMLIKVITDTQIEGEIDSDVLFKDLFNEGIMMISCYSCRKI